MRLDLYLLGSLQMHSLTVEDWGYFHGPFESKTWLFQGEYIIKNCALTRSA